MRLTAKDHLDHADLIRANGVITVRVTTSRGEVLVFKFKEPDDGQDH